MRMISLASLVVVAACGHSTSKGPPKNDATQKLQVVYGCPDAPPVP